MGDFCFFYSCDLILFSDYTDILFRAYILHSRKKERNVTFVKISLAKPVFYATPLQVIVLRRNFLAQIFDKKFFSIHTIKLSTNKC